MSIGSGTKWKKDATEDLKYLRGLSTATQGGTVYGTAIRYKDPEPENPHPKLIRLGRPAVGQKIKVQATNRDYEVAVDEQGKFKFSALPAGRYTILMDSNETVSITPPHLPTTFDLVDKGCARFQFWIDPFEKKESEMPLTAAPKPENRD